MTQRQRKLFDRTRSPVTDAFISLDDIARREKVTLAEADLILKQLREAGCAWQSFRDSVAGHPAPKIGD